MTALLTVRDLQTHFPIRSGLLNRVTGAVRAVDGVSFDIARGEVVGLVGESGSGKTTVGRTILRLEEATRGSVTFDGTELLELDRARMRPFRKRMQIIFQDPYASLNPRETVGGMLGHALALHRVGTPGDRRDRAARLMSQVGLSADFLDRYPHEFSGGQRQRIAIARALITRPDLILFDEAVSALDVSVRAQVLDLVADLCRRYGLAYLFISHDLSVVRGVTDRVLVMQAGRIVEEGPTEEVFSAPRHAYTRALIAAAPRLPDLPESDHA